MTTPSEDLYLLAQTTDASGVGPLTAPWTLTTYVREGVEAVTIHGTGQRSAPAPKGAIVGFTISLLTPPERVG